MDYSIVQKQAVKVYNKALSIDSDNKLIQQKINNIYE